MAIIMERQHNCLCCDHAVCQSVFTCWWCVKIAPCIIKLSSPSGKPIITFELEWHYRFPMIRPQWRDKYRWVQKISISATKLQCPYLIMTAHASQEVSRNQTMLLPMTLSHVLPEPQGFHVPSYHFTEYDQIWYGTDNPHSHIPQHKGVGFQNNHILGAQRYFHIIRYQRYTNQIWHGGRRNKSEQSFSAFFNGTWQ